jgi:hypothetical protein
MQTRTSRSSWSVANLNSPFHTAILVCLVATLSYLAAKLGGALILHPQNVWPLWPGCAPGISVVASAAEDLANTIAAALPRLPSMICSQACRLVRLFDSF